MDRSINGVSNSHFYAANASRLAMSRAMSEYRSLESRLREMEELGAGRLLRLPPDALTAVDKEYLKKYKALKADVEALHCMATTGSYPPGYVPKPKKDTGRPW